MLHDGPNPPVVRLRWVFTDQSSLDVPYHVINNRILNDDHDSDLPVGQLLIDDQTRAGNVGGKLYGTWPAGVECDYAQDERWIISPALTGAHICRIEWFTSGEPWPNDLPPTEYDVEGWPVCCGGFFDATAGGFEVGGQAGDAITYTDPTAGGVQIGGQAGSIPGGVDPTEGGVEIGGEAGDALTGTDPTAGGVEIGGEAGDALTGTDPTEGGVEIGGEAGDEPSVLDPTEGGVEIGGEAGDALTGTDPTEGGVEIGGEAGDALTGTDPTAGGVEIGGAAGDALTGTDPTAGGVEIGGAAGDGYTPGGPTVRDSTAGSTASSTLITLPTRVSGDRLVFFLTRPVGGSIPAANSGWTRIVNATTGATINSAVYVRTSDGTDSTMPVTFSTGLLLMAYVFVSVQNAGTTEQTGTQNATTTSVTAPAVTPAGAGNLLLCAFNWGRFSQPLGSTLTPPASMTLLHSPLWTDGTNTNGILAVCSEGYASSSSTGTRVGTLTVARDNMGIMVCER